MDSAILELKEALTILTDGNQDAYTGDFGPSAARMARNIAGRFEGVNGSLNSGWTTAEDFCVKIFNSVKDLLQDLYKQVDLYTDETYQAELAANAAVEAANDAAQSILAELGL